MGASKMAAAAKSEVEECIHKLQTTNKGVQLVIIVNTDGVPIRWLPANLEHGSVVQHASLISELALRAEKAISDLDPMNDWTFFARSITQARNHGVPRKGVYDDCTAGS